MKNLNLQHTKTPLALAAVLLVAGLTQAAEVHLRAEKFTKNLPGGVAVEMWGFALTDANFNGGTATVPGPALTVAPGDGTLTIHLSNSLPEPVSIVIPGQPAALGDVVRRPDGRVQSFTKEAAANTGTQDYTWSNLQPGTYLYHSGSHPALQVQMGLYGALKKDAAAGQAYAGVAYDAEVTLLLSDIDVEVHEAVRTGSYGPAGTIKSMIHSVPEYFLINGEPYTGAQVPLPAGQVDQTTLVRLLNTCYEERCPTLNGDYLTLVAEDGHPYAYTRQQYSVNLPSLKTRDALFVPDQAGIHVLYDRHLGLANGGMYQKLNVVP